ncbi:hypothetical protein QFC21_001027 [Naganishia friedmannii]|uniref:Uncharacterized protein n=1 Tax=Naganishia friedmannii TaxID=89922 RepID=A0ACC2W822_9TREE|nr:hypothetical protein QFC21_001027 [Naganishia friedmannii]
MAPFLHNFRSQSHSKKSKKATPFPTQSAATSSAASSTSSTSTSTNEGSDARPSPASSASSFSLSSPSTPPESSSPMTEVAIAPEGLLTYQSLSVPPDFGNLSFSGSGPFPVLNNSRHSVDPHGLSRYLMNPEDPILDYMYPVPMRPKAKATAPIHETADTASSTRPHGKSRQSSFSLFGKKATHVSSPLARSPVLEAQNVIGGSSAAGTSESSSAETIHQPLDGSRSSKTQNDSEESSSSKQDSGLLPTLTSTERSVSPGARDVQKPLDNIAKSVAMSSRSMSLDSLDKRIGSSQTSLLSTCTESTDGMKTPVVENESLPPTLHVATGHENGEFLGPILDTSKERTPTAIVRRPGLISGVKTWLGVNKLDKVKKEKLQVKKPKNLRPAPEISTVLSADPLSGTLPGSIPLSASTLVEEELHIPEQVSPRELECIKTIHRMTLDKLHAIRAVNGSHPAAVDVVDKISYQRNLLLNPAIAQLQSPRSSSPLIDLGSCIFPQQDIFEIDVQLISILRKLDARQFDDAQIQEIKHLKMTALQSRREKQKRWSQLARSRSDDQSGIGIARFVQRPCFEDRMVEIGSDMQPRQVRTARGLGMWEPEFTKQTEGWVELAHQNLLKRSERLGRYPSSQPSPRRPTSGLQAHSSVENLASTSAVLPERTRESVTRDTRQSPPRKTLSHASSSLNLWAPTRHEDRRQRPSDEQDDESEEDESDESDPDDVPLSTFRNSSRPASRVDPPAPDRSSHYLQTLSRPPSMMMPVTTPQPLNGPNAVPAVQLLQSKRGSSQDLVKYRGEYLKVRNRIEKARSGDVERERMSQAIRERTKSTTHAAAPSAHPRRESAKDLRIDTKNKATRAGSLSAPSSPRRHSRNISYSSAMPKSTTATNQSRPAINSRQTALGISDAQLSQSQYATGNGLARRSMSYADVGNAPNHMYGMPNMAQQVMFVPVPMMPFAPMVNPYGMPMQANAQQMMMQQQQQHMMHQHQQQQQQSRPRRQSTMDLSSAANPGQQQQYERSTLPRGGGRGRAEGREPVR